MMHNPMLSSCYMKKNVPWHVSTPCTLFCDRLRLRAVCASGHSEHIILSQPYMLRRELSSSLSRSYRSRIFLLRLSYRLRDHESFPAVLIEYTKYFVKRIYSMSSKTKIIVLRMKEIIYTALLSALPSSSSCSSSLCSARRRTTSPGARQTRPPRTPHRPLLPPLHTFRDFIRPHRFGAARTPMWRSQWTVQGSAPYLSCL